MAPNSQAPAKDSILQLPLSVVTKVDVGRLLREVEALDAFMQQSQLREAGTQPKLPKTSSLLEETAEINKLNLLVEGDRRRLDSFLKEVRTSAPIMHMSFSADPSAKFTNKLITWLRTEIHPLVLLQIGMQPNIGAGCVVRTTNQYFDFSLRSRLKQSKDVLEGMLSGDKA